jgi:hypothetical protein
MSAMIAGVYSTGRPGCRFAGFFFVASFFAAVFFVCRLAGRLTRFFFFAFVFR